MTEKEKCAQGLLYDANYDTQLLTERNMAKKACFEYNQTPPDDFEKRERLIRDLFGKTAAHFCIEPVFFCDYGYNITIGDHFFMNHNCVILDGAPVTFGDHVFIAPNCGFYTAGHPLEKDQRNAGLEYARPITVGNDVWFGAGVMVMPGVTIGDNVVIGAGSIVNKDIPSDCVAVGNPCKVIKKMDGTTTHPQDKAIR
ncbi:MAG: sugar O-acetyltransferase [Bacteroidales bacterium]